MTEKCLIKIVGWGVGGVRDAVFLRVARKSQRVLSKQRLMVRGREEVSRGSWETVPNAHYFLKG